MENRHKAKRWLEIIVIGLLCGVTMVFVCVRVAEWNHPKVPLSDSIGVYSWDLSVFYPPGSPEAKRFLSGLKGKDIEGKYSDRPIYLRVLDPRASGNGEDMMIWDFEMRPEQLKQWQKQLRTNKKVDCIGTNCAKLSP